MRSVAASGVSLATFLGFTLLWLTTGLASLNASALQFTGHVLRGPVDAIVSAMWPLGEPELGAIAAAGLAALLIVRGRWRAGALVLALFAVLTAVELGMRAGLGLASHAGLRHALVHEYPSGHTARVPLLGSAVAWLIEPPARWAALAATALLTALVAMDRVDSTLQTAADVVGGLLLGAWLAISFVALLPRVESLPR